MQAPKSHRAAALSRAPVSCVRRLVPSLAVAATATSACVPSTSPAAESPGTSDAVELAALEDALRSSDGGDLLVAVERAEPRPGITALDRALDALGGRAAVLALTSLDYQASAARAVLSENFTAMEGAAPIGEIASRVRYDLAGGRLRADLAQHFTYGGNDSHLRFSIILSGLRSGGLSGGVGEIDGIENVFFTPTGALTPGGVGAESRERYLLDPVLALQAAARQPALATELAPVLLAGGRSLDRLRIDDPAQPIVLYIDATTGLVVALSTLEDSPLFKDRRTIAVFGWSAGPDHTLASPCFAALRAGPSWVLTEHRTAIRENDALDETLFAVQPGGPAPDPVAQARGAIHREYQIDLARLSFRLDAPQRFIKPIAIAPGVWMLAGSSHNSLVVEQRRGVVVVEAPLDEDRSQALLGWLAGQFPTKRVSHVIPSHHHEDHAGGLRAFVAAGATVVVAPTARALYERAFHAAATVDPDALSRAPRVPRFAVLVAGALTLPDADRPVAVYEIPNDHAEDMVAAYLPSQRVIFESDLYNPGAAAGPFPDRTRWGRQFHDAVVARGLAVDRVIGGHGGTASWAQMNQDLGIP